MSNFCKKKPIGVLLLRQVFFRGGKGAFCSKKGVMFHPWAKYFLEKKIRQTPPCVGGGGWGGGGGGGGARQGWDKQQTHQSCGGQRREARRGMRVPSRHGRCRRHSAVRPCGVCQLGPDILRRGRWIEQAYGRWIVVHAPLPHWRHGPPLFPLLLSSSTMLSYCTIQYSIHEAKYSKYDYFAYIRRKFIDGNCDVLPL